MKKLLSILFIGFIFAGCASVKPGLWQPLPNAIVVTRDITTKRSAFESRATTIPTGTYTLLVSNEYGWFYTSQNLEFKTQDKFLGLEKNRTYVGA
jgi:hypothetical protein